MNLKRKKKNLVLAVVLIVVLGMTVLSGCGSSDKNALKIGLPNEIGSLDSAFAYDFTTSPVVHNVTESLLIIDENGELQPELAESWQEVDSLTYTYDIRDNVTFSDGSPLTIDDVIFSLERYRDKSLASYLAWMYDSVGTIEKTGDWQITVKLKAADAFWQYVPSTTAGHIHSKAAVEKAGKEYGSPNSFPVGTGPYPVKRWNSGGDITLEYNKDYWDAANLGTPAVQSIIVQTIPEDTTRSLASQTGQIDIDFQTPSELLADLEASEYGSLVSLPCPGFGFLAFNCQKAPFDDVNVRKAIASALDIPPLQDTVIKDTGNLTNYMMVPDVLFIYEPDKWNEFKANVPKYEFNLDKAKEYLKASSKPDGFDCTLLVDEYTITNSMGLFIQQALKELGINVTIDKQANEQVTDQQFGSGIVNGVRPYDFGLFEWVSDFPDPAGVLNPLLITENGEEGGSNTAAYSNAKVDELLKKQLASTDTGERTDILIEAQQIVQEEQPYVTTWQKNWLFGVSKRISDPERVFNASYVWNFSAKNIKFS
jgi:peptide/nickel transport system substrate-binding protein